MIEFPTSGKATDVALAESVTPQGVHAYLAANGWMKLGPY